MVFERATRVPDHRGPRRTTARRRARPTASRSSPARSTAARRTTSTACRTRSAGPFNAYGPGELPDDEPGIAHAVPDLIRKALSGAARRCRSSGRASRRARSPTWTTSPTASSPPWATRPARTRTSTSRRPTSCTVAEIARIIWEACRQRSGGVRARAPAELRGRRPAPLAVGREGRAAARLGGPDRRRRGDRATQ